MQKLIFYKHPSGKTKAVKLGFIWMACFFGPVWALGNRLWSIFFALVALNVGARLFSAYAEHDGNLILNIFSFLIYFPIMYFSGKFAGVWQMLSLEKKGYQQVGTSDDLERAGQA